MPAGIVPKKMSGPVGRIRVCVGQFLLCKPEPKIVRIYTARLLACPRCSVCWGAACKTACKNNTNKQTNKRFSRHKPLANPALILVLLPKLEWPQRGTYYSPSPPPPPPSPSVSVAYKRVGVGLIIACSRRSDIGARRKRKGERKKGEGNGARGGSFSPRSNIRTPGTG